MTQPVWIEASDVLRLHDRLLALDGGMVGLRDDALLESALARPQQLHAYADTPDIIDMARPTRLASFKITSFSTATSAQGSWLAFCFWS